MLQKLRTIRTSVLALFAVASLSLASTSAHAVVDVTQAVTDITGLSTNMELIGGAIISLAVVALGIRWIKATFFS